MRGGGGGAGSRWRSENQKLLGSLKNYRPDGQG